MDIKKINSDINAVTGRLEQVKDSTLFNEKEKDFLTTRYTEQLGQLEQKKRDYDNQNTTNPGE